MSKTLIRGLFLALGVIAVAGALAGCGGGGGSSNGGGEGTNDTTVTTSSHSKAEFIKLANAICQRGKEAAQGKIGAYMKEHGAAEEGRAQSEKLFAQAVQAVLLPAIETQVEEIRTLGAPQGDEKRIEAFLAAFREAANAHRKGTVRSQNVFEKDFKRSGELAGEYGLESCSYAS